MKLDIKNKTILVVEDEASVRITALKMLQNLGYKTLEAEGVEEALLMLKQNNEVDLLLSDIVLSETQTGIELAAMARDENQHLRVVFMSGYTEHPSILDGSIKPGVNLLPKPFRLDDLARIISNALQ